MSSDRVHVNSSRRKQNILEYLDLSADPAVRLLVSCRSQKMHSRSMCDCYCRFRLPITRQRDEIHTEMSRGRGTKATVSRSLKRGTSRSGKKIPLIPARIIDDGQLDTKRSTVTFPVSPILSPETSAALEDVERLIKDAQIQMKEIGKATGSNRFRNQMNIYPDEAFLDDENDQLLYIRERVAYKFQEANGLIYTDNTSSKSQRYSTKDCAPMQSQKLIDLSAPRFNMSADRYKEFSLQRGLELKKFELTTSHVDPQRENDEKLKSDDHIRSTVAIVENNRKNDTCSVQMGPSVNIRAEPRTQNLEDIHISPDPSFIQETQNVATYVVCYDSGKRNTSLKRKEKFVKILEDSDDKNGDKKWTGETKKGNSRNEENIQKDTEKFKLITKECADMAIGDTKKFVEKEGPIHETEKSILTIFENEKYLESTTSKDLNDYHCNDRESSIDDNETIHDKRNVEQDVEVEKMAAGGSSVRIVNRNEQKQVRFDEGGLVASKSNVESIANLEQNLIIPSRQDDMGNVPISNDNTDPSIKTVRTSNGHVPLSSKEIREKHSSNKKRRREISDRRKSEKEERYKTIDKRFSCIVKTYCEQKENRGKINHSYITPSTSMNSTEDSEESDCLDHLYESSVNELDKVLVAYNKIINGVARSTRTIDEFLTRPEIEQYRVGNTYEIETAEKPFASTLPTRERNSSKMYRFESEKHTRLKTRKSIVEDPSTVSSQQLNFNDKRSSFMKHTPLNKPVFMEMDNDCRKSWKRCTVSKNSGPFSTRTNIKETDRASHWGKYPRKETTESNRDSETVERRIEKQSRFLGTRSPRTENDSSCLTTSSTCPLSSSSDTKVVDDIKMSSTVNNEATDFRLTVVDSGKVDKINGKENFDYRSLQNTVRESTMKRGCSETKNTKGLIARVLREEASFIENKIKNIFNVEEIVGVIVKSLVENLKDKKLGFGPTDLELLISGNVPLSNAACGNNGIIETKSDDDSVKRSFQIECVQSEDNFDGAETITCNVEIVEKSDSYGSVGKNVNAETVYNFAYRLPPMSTESRSIKKNSSVEKIDDGINSVDGSLEENLNEHDNGNNVVYDKNSDTGKDENVTSLGSRDNQVKACDDKSLSCQETKTSVVDQQSISKEYQTLDTLEGQSISQNSNEIVILSSKDDVNKMENIDKILLAKKNVSAEDQLKYDPSVLSGKLAPSSGAILPAEKGASVASQPTDKTEKAVASSGNNFSHASSSDSLHGCLSLRSSSRNLSKTSSNNAELSQDVKEIVQVPEIGSVIDDEERNASSSCFDYIFDKGKILSEVYDEVRRKFCSSSLDTNYANVLNQIIRLPNEISTISTVESNKVDMLSDTSHSEGELYLPSSGSYSLGEVRMLTKNRSDGENVDDFDDNLTAFVTKEMVASWRESSKSLIQSIGEI